MPLRHVAQVGPRGQVDRRRKLRQEVVGQVEVEIEAGQVAAFLLLDLVDVEAAETACRLRHDSDAAAAGSPWATVPSRGSPSGVMAARLCQLTPSGSFTRTPSWTGLPRDMVTPWRRAVAQVVAFLQKILLALGVGGLRHFHALDGVGELFRSRHGGIAGFGLWRNGVLRQHRRRAQNDPDARRRCIYAFLMALHRYSSQCRPQRCSAAPTGLGTSLASIVRINTFGTPRFPPSSWC